MNFRFSFILAVVTTVACGPSGPQNIIFGEDDGEYADSNENEMSNYNNEYEEEYDNNDEYEEEYDNYNEYEEEYDDNDEYEDEYEDLPDELDEEEEGYVELPDWMDADLDQLSHENISLLSSAGSLTQMMTMLELNKEQQDKLDKDVEFQLENEGPVKIGVRSFGSNDEGNAIVPKAEPAGCKPELEVVKLELPRKGQYLPECVRLPRCGGCCLSSLLSCQPNSTESISLKVMKVKKKNRSRRSTRAKIAIVDQVKHLDCTCQCRIKEHDCDSRIQDYKESECACVCKNRDEAAECSKKNSHYWDSKSCSCRCTKTPECSTGEEVNNTTCRCVPIIEGKIFNANVCDSFCVNGKPKRCSCRKGWKGRRCNRRVLKVLQSYSSQPSREANCDPGCVHGRCVSPGICECQQGWRGDQCQDRCNCIPVQKCGPLLPLTKVPNERNRNILSKARCDTSSNSLKVCCPSLLPSNCGRSAINNQERIYGGKEVKMGKYPWIALLGYTCSNNPDEELYHCGGSVINERYVLTAAHCVSDLSNRYCRNKKLISVKLGEWDQSTEKDCDENKMCLPFPLVYRPEKVIVHPKYNTRSKHSDDIALIRLNASVNIDDESFIHAICLPEPSMDIRQVIKAYKRNRGNLELFAAGWGVTENKTLSHRLLEVELPLFKDSLCNETYQGLIVPGQMCAGGRFGEDSCNADSGGPLILPGPTSTTPYLQVGLVSFGLPQGCGIQAVPGVYTEVSLYREWIEENLFP